MSEKEKLEELNKKISRCNKCTLYCKTSRIVPGIGNPEAKIMFIGEAPGKKENETGMPFMGSAGKFLNEMLGLINLQRENVFITNICKCRPPQNRDPLPIEIAICWHWLEKQIQIINPTLIVTLGRHSLGRFFPKLKISTTHGKFFQAELPKIGRKNFYVLYHPAAALYNRSLRETLKKDFKKIPRILKNIN